MHYEDSNSKSFKILPIRHHRPRSGLGFKVKQVISIDNDDNKMSIKEKIVKYEQLKDALGKKCQEISALLLKYDQDLRQTRQKSLIHKIIYEYINILLKFKKLKSRIQDCED